MRRAEQEKTFSHMHLVYYIKNIAIIIYMSSRNISRTTISRVNGTRESIPAAKSKLPKRIICIFVSLS